MSGEKNVIRIWQRPAIKQRFISRNWFRRLEALPKPSAKNIHRDAELITAHIGLCRNLVRIDINHFHDPIRISTAGCGDEIHDWLAADLDRLSQDVRDKRKHVGTARGFALIVNKPQRPEGASRRFNWPSAKGNGFSGIGDVFIENRITRFWGIET